MCSESCLNFLVITFDLRLSGRISARVSWPESEIFPRQVSENWEKFCRSSNFTTLVQSANFFVSILRDYCLHAAMAQKIDGASVTGVGVETLNHGKCHPVVIALGGVK
jgi:hypothetical protein